MDVFAHDESSKSPGQITIEHIEALKQHERTDIKRLEEVKKSILEEGLNFPVVADKKTKLVLDGHHRLNALKQLGIRNISVFYVDYFDERIVLESWKKQKITKEEVIHSVAAGKIFPKKTTKHMFLSEKGLMHISSIVPKATIDISMLDKTEGDNIV